MAGIFRDHLLLDKVAFVTGGGSGIGQRMAERFAEHGAKVVLVGRKQEKLDAAASAIRDAGGFAETAALDVRDYAAVEAAVKKTREDLGEIDILLCGAAGILRGRQATTHWATWNLLPYYGAIPVRSRVVVDGNLVTAAGVTAGLDAALVVASLLRGDRIAQEIQLSIQYAPNPVFHSGTPETAPAEVLQAFNQSYSAIAASREAEARRFAAILGVTV